jgi:uncharacterized protein
MLNITPSSTFLTEAELNFLNQTLIKYGNDTSVLDVSELDGFLTAVVSGPNIIPPNRWFSAIWGGTSLEPEWESESEMQRFMMLTKQLLNNTTDTLNNQPDAFEALFNRREIDGKQHLITDEWCQGYMRGIRLDENSWAQTPPKLINEQMASINVFAGECGPQLEQLDDTAIAKLQSKIEPAARTLHSYWLKQRKAQQSGKTTPTRTLVKIGRNEPCPCGSGKKYKQCCLN